VADDQTTVEILIGGMTCASCVARNEKALRRVPGVVTASVNFATEKATVEYLPGIASRDDLVEAVRRAGYEVAEPARPTVGAGVEEAAGLAQDPDALARRAAYVRLRRKVVIGAVLSTLVFLGSMGFAFVPAVLTNGWLLWALATPVQFWVGREFYRGALERHRATAAPTMNTLIVHGFVGGLFLQRRRRPLPKLLQTTMVWARRCTSTRPR
jgi:Cu+-exporting ATPase